MNEEGGVFSQQELRLHEIAKRIRNDSGMNRTDEFRKDQPAVVTLCGSTRFRPLFELANKVLTLHGIIVISLGLFGNEDKAVSDEEALGERVKKELDALHFRKIDHSDSILLLNEDFYLGPSAYNEMKYAKHRGKRIYWLHELPLSVREIVNEWAKQAKVDAPAMPVIGRDILAGEGTWPDTTDAMEWAKQFCSMHRGKLIAEREADEGLMVGWFANAMAAAEREAKRAVLVVDKPESGELPLISKELLGALCALYMASDPSPLSSRADLMVEEFLAHCAGEYGYDGWVAAFHDLNGIGKPRHADIDPASLKKDLDTVKGDGAADYEARDGFGVAGLKPLPPEETLYADGKPMISITIYPQGV